MLKQYSLVKSFLKCELLIKTLINLRYWVYVHGPLEVFKFIDLYFESIKMRILSHN